MNASNIAIMKEVPNINNIKLKKVRLKLDINLLDSMIAFIYKESVLRTRKALNSLYKLVNMLDMNLYKSNDDAYSRLWVIEKSLEAKLVKGFENKSAVIQYCRDAIGSNELIDEILDNLDSFKLSYDEAKYLIKTVDDRVRFGYVVTLKDVYQKILDRIDDNDFRSYQAVSEDLYDIAASVVNINRNINSSITDMTFSLKDELFEEVVSDCVEKLKDKNKVFITGIRKLNAILSPGYLSKKLYTFLAFPGGGKSAILLKSALDIRKYNSVDCEDPNKTPAVLLITMENDIDETVERIFNMTVSSEDIRNYTPKQVIKKLKNEGGLTLSDKNNIDIIIKYYPNRSIDTNDLYSIIKDLYDEGTEVVVLILDYIKRIKPAEKANTEKEELKNISNELKTLARLLEIPVITAHQLNRVGASVVDAAIQNKKEDVTRLIGRDAISGAWEVNENSDMLIIINQEVKYDTGDLYLTFKMLKRRYRSTSSDSKRNDYFNHPYEKGSTIKLIDDLELPKSVSLLSLGSKFVAYEDVKKMANKSSGVERKNLDKNDEENGYEEFDPRVTLNF